MFHTISEILISHGLTCVLKHNIEKSRICTLWNIKHPKTRDYSSEWHSVLYSWGVRFILALHGWEWEVIMGLPKRAIVMWCSSAHRYKLKWVCWSVEGEPEGGVGQGKKQFRLCGKKVELDLTFISWVIRSKWGIQVSRKLLLSLDNNHKLLHQINSMNRFWLSYGIHIIMLEIRKTYTHKHHTTAEHNAIALA